MTLHERIAALNEVKSTTPSGDCSQWEVVDADEFAEAKAIITEVQEVMREVADKLTPIKNVDCHGRDISEAIAKLTTALGEK
jgi:hypothetical protein